MVQQFSPKHLLSCFVPYMMATIHCMGTGNFELLTEKPLYRIVFLFLKQYYHICKLLQQSKFRSRQFWIMWYRCNATISFRRCCINSTIYLRCNKILLLLLCLYHHEKTIYWFHIKQYLAHWIKLYSFHPPFSLDFQWTRAFKLDICLHENRFNFIRQKHLVMKVESSPTFFPPHCCTCNIHGFVCISITHA